MATTSTNTVIAHTNTATFNTWVTEIFTALVTTLGLTQTADTGQTAPGSYVYSATLLTVAGFIVLRFNDTLQATSPLFMKLEFGTGSAATAPRMLITIGSGTNGAGTITGIVGTRVACFSDSAPSSTVTNYTSRFCYNTTQGYLGVAFKEKGTNGTTVSIGGFALWRSVDSSGAPTSVSAMLVANSPTTNGAPSGGGSFQAIDYSLSSTLTPLSTLTVWAVAPLGATASLEGTNGQVFPAFQWAPTATVPPYGITNALALIINAEIALDATVIVTILGSTSLTYINAGPFYGGSVAPGNLSITTYSPLMLWT